MLPLVLTLTLSAGDIVGGQGVHHEEHYEPSPYRYEYNVHDDKVYLDFRAEEEGDGQDNVHGFYHVQLPDGRLQKVTYTVNSDSGYVADVTYDGEAVHPAYHAGGGHGGGHRFGKSLVQEPFQRGSSITVDSGRSGKSLVREPIQQRPKISVQSERAGKSHIENQEGENFSGGFFGSSSRHSNSAPSEINEPFQRKPLIPVQSDRSGKSNVEEPNFSQGFFGSSSSPSNSIPSEKQEKSIPKPNPSTFPRIEDQPSTKKPFTLERKPLKRVFKKFDQSKVSQPKSKPFTTFAKADKKNFQSKLTNFGGKKTPFTNQDINEGKLEKSKPSTFSSGSPKTLDEFLKTFEPKSSSFGGGEKPFTNQGFNIGKKEKNRPKSGSPKTLDEFLKTFESKSSKFTQLKNSQNKTPNVPSESAIGRFRNRPPIFDSSSNSSRRPEQSRSSKNLKSITSKKQKSSLIVHRPLDPQ